MIQQPRSPLGTLAAMVLTLGAVSCGSSSYKPPAVTERTVTQVFQVAARPALDILFVMDNAPATSGAGLQAQLARTFPQFMAILEGLPGGLPDLHVAVVSSNMGAGPTAMAGCPVGGDRGAFQSAPRVAGCTTGLPSGQDYLSASCVNNFTGDLSDAFSCIAALGSDGCLFPHPFASLLKALEPGSDQPAGNAGFLRPNAYLLIVLITTQDDCSAPPDSGLFDGSSRLVSDPLGPLASFRCNEFGHLCAGEKPPRSPAVLTDCTSAEGGPLLPVADVVNRIVALKNGDTSRVFAAAIAGPPTPYVVTVAQRTTASGVTEDEPQIAPSCTQAISGAHGDPAIRINQWVDAFNGTFVPVCDDNLLPALSQIAQSAGSVLGPTCVVGKLVDRDLSTPGVQPDCAVTKVQDDARGQRTETLVPSCGASPGSGPCWTIMDDPGCHLGTPQQASSLLKIEQDDPCQGGLNVVVSCGVCLPADGNPGCQY